MRYVSYAVALLFLEIFFLVSCRGDETPPPSPTLTPTRTLIPSATLPPPTATDTPYPTDTPTQRSPTNTLSATLTQTWPETPTPTPTITRTPTRTPTGQPTPTVTGTPPTATLTPTITNTPSGSATPTSSPTPSPSPTPTGTTTTEALLAVEPATTTITGVGNSALIYLYLTNASGVYGIDLQLSYDANLFTVIDLNPSRDGTQVQPGTCPKPDNVSVNIVDVDENEGTISYRVTQLSPTLPCNGGLVLIMQFECVAVTNDAVTLSIDDAQVSGVGIDIETVLQDGTLTCQP